MGFNNIKKKFVFMIGSFASFSLLLFLLLNLNFISNFIPIYTYRGFVCILVISLLLLISTILFKKFKFTYIDFKDITILMLAFLLIHLLMFGMVAITIERAFSVFMLNEISKAQNQEITLDESKELFKNDFIDQHKALEKRFNEQISTGTLVKVSENKYKMTTKGNIIVELFKIFNSIYNIRSDLL